MRKRWFIMATILVIVYAGGASAKWVDYCTWWGGSDCCRRILSQPNCQPPLGEDVECIYYDQLQSCCCQGLVWAPDAPTNIVTTPNGNAIHITWNADSTATEYRLWWGTSAAIHLGDDNLFVLTDNEFTHKNLKYDKKYYYYLQARNQYGRSGTDFSARTGPNPNPPPKPDSLRSFVFLSKGNGSFSAPIYSGVRYGNYRGYDWKFGDFDGDGRDDFLLCKLISSKRLSADVSFSMGDGTFGRRCFEIVNGSFGVGVNGSTKVWEKNVGDFSSDGRDDIILYYNNNSYFRSMVLVGRRNGQEGFQGFLPPIQTILHGKYAGWKRTVGDFNGDNYDDVLIYRLTANKLTSHVALSRGGGARTFRKPISWSMKTNGHGQYRGSHLKTGDFNGDGYDDMILVSATSGVIQTFVALSRGDGTFRDPVWGFRLYNITKKWDRNIGDVNGDGMDDLVFYRCGDSRFGTRVAFSNGTGTFDAPIKWTYKRKFAGWHRDLGDFNGDGKKDIILYRQR